MKEMLTNVTVSCYDNQAEDYLDEAWQDSWFLCRVVVLEYSTSAVDIVYQASRLRFADSLDCYPQRTAVEILDLENACDSKW